MELDKNVDHDRHEHHNMHRTIDDLIEQAAIKTRSAVRIIFIFVLVFETISKKTFRLRKYGNNTMKIYKNLWKNITIWKRYICALF